MMNEKLEMNHLLQKDEIKNILITYAEACDKRIWSLYDEVFDEDIQVNYGGAFKISGRGEVVKMIRSMLGGCGPTQHMLGNFRIKIEGKTAQCICYVRAIHASMEENENELYEVWAEYKDKLIRTEQGWRIIDREMIVSKEVGNRGVLGPG